MSILMAVVDGEPVIEYDRDKVLPDNQLEYLNKMDEKMDMGIPSGQGNVFAPDQEQRAYFIADQLMSAIKSADEQLIAASMAYLAVRLPDLKQVSSKVKEGDTQISLIYDREYSAQVMNFIKPEHLNS